jgi:hypothetical protein
MWKRKTRRFGLRSMATVELRVLQQPPTLEVSHALERAVAAVAEHSPVPSHVYAQSGPSSAEVQVSR